MNDVKKNSPFTFYQSNIKHLLVPLIPVYKTHEIDQIDSSNDARQTIAAKTEAYLTSNHSQELYDQTVLLIKKHLASLYTEIKNLQYSTDAYEKIMGIGDYTNAYSNKSNAKVMWKLMPETELTTCSPVQETDVYVYILGCLSLIHAAALMRKTDALSETILACSLSKSCFAWRVQTSCRPGDAEYTIDVPPFVSINVCRALLHLSVATELMRESYSGFLIDGSSLSSLTSDSLRIYSHIKAADGQLDLLRHSKRWPIAELSKNLVFLSKCYMHLLKVGVMTSKALLPDASPDDEYTVMNCIEDAIYYIGDSDVVAFLTSARDRVTRTFKTNAGSRIFLTINRLSEMVKSTVVRTGSDSKNAMITKELKDSIDRETKTIGAIEFKPLVIELMRIK